ncbi:MAG: TetR/AcrR family transcriptional regulator [Microthrixaceae bacterium]|nr:TetR/AcrR family transcriptional regulator [Acidimicrobiales bacterium]MCB9403804.1 TetR/AcrR family transcriptional regulator [Microthrixaceae bacterium]
MTATLVPRRTQEDRSTATQRALLEATIECLVDHGYAGTTTRLVADRAQVSRGAQTHHYPTKRDLVEAAIGHLFEDQARRFAAVFDEVPPRERTLDRAVDELWAIVSGPAYAAVLEVVVASRTDPELRQVVHDLAGVLETKVVELLLWFSPDIADPDLARRTIDLAFTLVQGAAISRLGGFGRPDEVIELAKSVAASMVAGLADQSLLPNPDPIPSTVLQERK